MATNTGQFNGNVALLVAAPMLQDYLVDDVSGLPLANGTVTFYQDNSRTTLKNVYYQTGSPGNYTYFTLPNPLPLSSVGTIVDVNGNDTIPFYYPVSEFDNKTPQPYYVTVVNSNGQAQFTRQNFPFVASSGGGTPTNTNPTESNLIVNNVFWRNVGSLVLPSSTSSYSSIVINGKTLYYKTIAPSQHDGYIMPDIIFVKDTADATETINFNKFTTNALPNDVTPEFYFNLACTGAGTETVKYLQIPIQLHITNFAGYTQASASVWVQSVSGGSTVTMSIYQFAGTGGVTAAVVPSKTINATAAWTQYTVNFTFPLASAATLGLGGDDAWYLQLGLPVAQTTNINIAKPAVYLSQTQPTDDFQTYDQAASIFESPRTGDIRLSINSFTPFGWIPMNDGTIGSASSSGTTRANIDTWQLYNLIYSSVLDHWAPVSGGRTGNAYNDFTANKTITLTRSLGRVFAGLNATANMAQNFTTNYAGSHNNLTITSSTEFPTGTPVQLTNTGGALPSSLAANTVYFVININVTTIQLATTIENAYASTPIDIGSDQTGTSTVQTALGAYVGESLHTLTTAQLAAHTHSGGQVLGSGGEPVADTFSAGATVFFDVTGTVGNGTPNVWSVTTGSAGSGTPFNVIQPTTYMNVLIKL